MADGGAPNEAALVERARSGDMPAWKQLVETHQELVFRTALLLTGSAEDAEDIAQDTFLRAYRRLNRFHSDQPLRPWLLTIAGRLAKNRRRGLGRYFRFLGRWAAHSAETHSSRADDMESVFGALIDQLSTAGRQVIYLRYFLDLSEAEIAEILGIPNGTVKSRAARALAKLEAVVRAQHPDLIAERVND